MRTNTLQIERFEAIFSPEELWFVNILFRDNPVEMNFFNEDESTFLCIFAKRNGLAPLFYRSSYVDCLPAKCKLELRKEYLFNLGRNTAFQLIADEIITLLNNAGIPAILLKGSFLAPYIYPDLAFRPMGDIDILVPLHQVNEAWKLLNPNEDIASLHQEETGHHLPPFLIRGCLIEIHKSLFPTNTKFTIPVDDIWAAAIPIQGKKSLTVNPVHQVIYLSLHIYYSYRRGGMRLGWFYDIKLILNHYNDEINLQLVKDDAQKWKVWEPVELMLMFFSVLVPGNKLDVAVPKSLALTIEEMILMVQKSENQKLEYSYGVAWERLWHTIGFCNKAKFLWNVVTVHKNGRKQLSFYRLWHLFRNTGRFLMRKVLGSRA